MIGYRLNRSYAVIKYFYLLMKSVNDICLSLNFLSLLHFVEVVLQNLTEMEVRVY